MTLWIKFFASLALIPLAAFVYQDLYQWFVVPLGAPDLTYAHVLGLVMLKGLLFFSHADTKDASVTNGYSILALAWGVGAMAAWWMP